MGCFACVVKRPQPRESGLTALQAAQGIQSCSSHAGFQLRGRSICLPVHLRGDVRVVGIVESSRDIGPKLSVQPAEGVMILAKMWRRRYPRVAKSFADSIEEVEVMA